MKKWLIAGTSFLVASPIVVATSLYVDVPWGWVFDENWKPDIKPASSDECLHENEATIAYFEDAIKNPKIFEEDYYYTSIVNHKQHLENLRNNPNQYENIDGSFMARIRDVKPSKITRPDNTVYYTMSCIFELKTIYTYDLVQGNIRTSYTDTVDQFCLYENIQMVLQNGGPFWNVGVFSFHEYEGYKWHYKLDKLSSKRTYVVDESTGEVLSDETTHNDIHQEKDQETGGMPASIITYSYYFSEIGPFKKLNVEGNIPSGFKPPRLEKSEIGRGKPYESTIHFQTKGDGKEYEIQAVALTQYGQMFEVDKKYWSFDNITYGDDDTTATLKIDAFDDEGNPIAIWEMYLYIEYTEVK